MLGASIAPAVVLALFVLIGNPVIVMVIMGAMGYSKRPSFLAGLTVAQISEFSLIFVAMGISLGHIEETALGLVTLVGLVTIAASTYMITWSHELYRLLEPLLGVFERRRRTPHETGWRRSGGDYDVVLFGLGRYGSGIAAELERRGLRVLGVDFDPVAVRHARTRGIDALFGDAAIPSSSAICHCTTRRRSSRRCRVTASASPSTTRGVRCCVRCSRSASRGGSR